MTKSASSGFAGLTVIVALAVVIALAGTYFVISSRIDNEQANSTGNSSQTDIDKPLDTAASNSANDIEKELNVLTEDDYSDSDLSDTALYE